MSGCIGCPHTKECDWIKNNIGENPRCGQDHPLKITGYRKATAVLWNNKGGMIAVPHERPIYS
jgi:hypothetical protein